MGVLRSPGRSETSRIMCNPLPQLYVIPCQDMAKSYIGVSQPPSLKLPALLHWTSWRAKEGKKRESWEARKLGGSRFKAEGSGFEVEFIDAV